jgi:predicted Zn-dependent protease
MMGMIKEKNKSYSEAISYYERAWEYSNKSSANIGYKLAASYINNRSSVKAINICNEIKRKFPDYPIDDLLMQAKNSLNG